MVSGRNHTPADSAQCLLSGPEFFRPGLPTDRWQHPITRPGSTGTKTEAAAKQTPKTYTLGLICLCVWGNDDALEKLRSWSNFTTQKKANSTIRNLNNVCTSYYHHQDCSSGFHTSKRTIFAIKVIANTDLYLKSAATKKILLLVGSPVNHFIHNLRKGCMRPCITMKTGVQESLDKQKLLPKFFKRPKDYSTRGLATWFS